MDKYQKMQEVLQDEGLLEWLLWAYAIVGGLFIIYSFVIFIQTYIPIFYRLSQTVIFLIIGMLFLNLTGRLVTGYYIHFTIATIIITYLLALLGGLFIVLSFRDSKRGRYEYKKFKNKNYDTK